MSPSGVAGVGAGEVQVEEVAEPIEELPCEPIPGLLLRLRGLILSRLPSFRRRRSPEEEVSLAQGPPAALPAPGCSVNRRGPIKPPAPGEPSADASILLREEGSGTAPAAVRGEVTALLVLGGRTRSSFTAAVRRSREGLSWGQKMGLG